MRANHSEDCGKGLARRKTGVDLKMLLSPSDKKEKEVTINGFE